MQESCVCKSQQLEWMRGKCWDSFKSLGFCGTIRAQLFHLDNFISIRSIGVYKIAIMRYKWPQQNTVGLQAMLMELGGKY